MSIPPFAPGLPSPVEVWSLPATGDAPNRETWEDNKVRGVDLPCVGYFPAQAARHSGAAVVICPGGRYEWLSMLYEGTRVAEWLNALGVAAFILKSRVTHHQHPEPLIDVCGAVRRVRARSASLGLDPQRIGVMGFSAGGHLAASACTMWDSAEGKDSDAALAEVSARPDFAMLAYPVISMEVPLAHERSRECLLGVSPTNETIAMTSLHLRVTRDVPRTCLIHAADDERVSVEHSLLYFRALRAAGVESELHIYPRGGHGFGMKPDLPAPVNRWPDRFGDWLAAAGVLN